MSIERMITPILFEKKLQYLVENYASQKFLLAVSGGVDSMVLANLFLKCKLEFEVAHINYQLRGENSEKDQELVENFCKKNKISFHLYKVTKKDQQPSGSIQNWARELRYTFFRKIMHKEKINFLVTAHHLNDQLETFIINLSKASGLKGLSGIPKNENKIIRPFLDFDKDSIYEFAQENSIDFREDQSNQENYYLRNQIRNIISPELLKINNYFLENFNKSLQLIIDSKDFIQQQISIIQESLTLSSNKTSIILDKKNLSKQSKLVQYEILKKFGFDDEKEISKIFSASTGKSFFSDDFQLLINRNELILMKKMEVGSRKMEVGSGKWEVDEIILEINEKNEIDISDFIDKDCILPQHFEWKFDLETLSLPLKIRTKKEGDVIFPIGMIGKKKVSKFFKDEKISILAKSKFKILCDANNNVLGIIPLRQDRRCIAKSESTNVLKIIIDKKSI